MVKQVRQPFGLMGYPVGDLNMHSAAHLSWAITIRNLDVEK